MSRRRRRSNPNAGNGGNGGGGGGAHGQGGQGGKGHQGGGQSSDAVATFWSEPDEEPTPPEPIRPTSMPAAIPHSLGEPPLQPEAAAAHHLAVVYEEAVRAATALAAANGLLADEALEELTED
ncbi:MAG TPA: hypothetical protein VK306_12795 [Acidimicrobiales bacterium]|nr:hypothetical protein [Acidimicrobiales bacterium]